MRMTETSDDNNCHEHKYKKQFSYLSDTVQYVSDTVQYVSDIV